ncbi:Uncharacterized protein HA466_0099260 [Hirschfeldia incana]|nr:Uncharacterized protein HA466_0099260 [Hirschfeldia incana]
MARISLLLSFAITLSLGSLFLFVSSHALPVPLIPKTVSELQTLPFAKITEILNHKEKFAPKTAKIKTMFTMCKGYVGYLESLYKSENPIVDVLGIAKTKYALTTKAISAVQASISGEVDKKTSLKLRKSCAGLTKAFLHIQKAIAKISAKHNYKADANINFRESKQITDAILYFRNSINDFMDLVNDFEEKKMKKVVNHARSLEKEDEDVGRAISHGRELTEEQAGNNTTEKVNGSDQSKHDKYFQFFGSFLEGKQHGRELTESQADGKVNNLYEEFAKYTSYLGGKHHGRKLLEDQAGDKDGAQGSGEFKGSFESFFRYFNGNEKVQMDAAGKMKVAGKDGFRSQNRAHYKLFVSKEA